MPAFLFLSATTCSNHPPPCSDSPVGHVYWQLTAIVLAVHCYRVRSPLLSRGELTAIKESIYSQQKEGKVLSARPRNILRPSSTKGKQQESNTDKKALADSNFSLQGLHSCLFLHRENYAPTESFKMEGTKECRTVKIRLRQVYRIPRQEMGCLQLVATLVEVGSYRLSLQRLYLMQEESRPGND